jgi:protein-S-isoprenylcysteine O-methyltransferase Ste14
MSEIILDKPKARPASAVSHGVGVVGLIGLFTWLSIALYTGLDGPYSALVNVAACGVPMILWSIFVDKVHRNPSTGIDWDATPRSFSAISDNSITKLAGFWATWALIAGLYCIFRFYWRDNYLFAMEMFTSAAPVLFVMSIPYVFWIDRRLIEPRDSVWHFGAWLMGRSDFDAQEIFKHLRSWAVKGFFLAFMLSIVPANFRVVVAADFVAIQNDPVALIVWLINLMFVIDVAMATNGYLLTMRPLDSHIRTATPHAAGWTAALICYPPFIMMGGNGPLDYHPQTAEWSQWLAPYPAALIGVGAVLVILTAIYAWATVAFGIRFSNLTDRGILTHGPYAWTKHPAYLSKNLFWWLSTMPFLATSGSPIDVIRNSAILAMVSGIYYWRAKTEEWHLSVNAEYRDYAAWMDEHGIFTKAKRLFARGKAPVSIAPAE